MVGWFTLWRKTYSFLLLGGNMQVGDLVRDTERGDLGLILAVDDTAGFVKVMFSGGQGTAKGIDYYRGQW